MRVGVFFRKVERQFIEQVLGLLRDSGLAASAYRVGATWRELNGKEIEHHFSEISHFVLMPDSTAYQDDWFAFIVGYAMGRMSPVFLFQHDEVEQPAFLSGFHCVNNTEVLRDELMQQKSLFEQSSIVEQARFELADEGIGLNDENLAACVAEGNQNAVENFFRMGFSPNTTNARGVPLLNLAVRKRHSSLVRLIVDSGAQVNLIAEDRGTTALMEAAGLGELPYVRLLIEQGADLQLQSKTGQNALILAASEGHTEVVRELVKYNLDFSATDSLGMTALRYAELFGYSQMAEILTQARELDLQKVEQ